MLLKFLFITIIGVSLVHAYIRKTRESSSDYECRYYLELCDPDHFTPCCEENHECTKIESLSEHYCINQAGLDMKCYEDYDCYDNYSVCSKDSQKCTCDKNYITRDGSCQSIIGGNCDTDSDCLPFNSVCLNDFCECEHNFKPISDRECITIFLELPCQEDKDCYDINRAMCSENNTCTCRENSISKNGMCLSLIDGYCDNDHDCSPIDTLCIQNKCRCKPSFLPSLDKLHCVLSYFNQTCEKKSDCYDTDRAMCSKDKRCICRPNHQTVNNATCISLIGGFCWRHSDCLPENTICIFDKCLCDLNFRADESNLQCVPKLRTFCELDEDCYKIRHAKCSKDKECVCRDDTIPLDDIKCAPLLGGFCWKNEKCAVNNSICANNTCRCQVGFSFQSKFECSEGVYDGKTLLGETCQISSECRPQNSFCVDKKCQCKSGLVPKFNDQCIPATLGSPCEIDKDCAEVTHAMCSKNEKRCICRPNNSELNSSRCAPILGGFCWKNEPCAITNSVCVDNECQCKKYYKALSQHQCII